MKRRAESKPLKPNDFSSPSIDVRIKSIYTQLTELDTTSSGFFQKILLLQEEILKIEALEYLSQDQIKALQLEISCIEDHITLISIKRDIELTSYPSKDLLLKLKYTMDDISYCLQNLRSIFS